MDFMALLAEERRKAREKASPPSKQNPPQEAGGQERVLEQRKHFPQLSLTENLSGVAKLRERGLESFQVGKGRVDRVFYIADFVNEREEAELLKQVYCDAASWTTLKYRRLQSYSQTAEESTMPPWLEFLSDQLVSAGVFLSRPNNALLNEYKPGQGILGHTDGPCYAPLVGCLSLGSPAIICFSERLSPAEIGERESRVLAKVLLQPRSLVVFDRDAYSNALHEIAPVAMEVVDEDVVNAVDCGVSRGDLVERKTRVSITLRSWTRSG